MPNPSPAIAEIKEHVKQRFQEISARHFIATFWAESYHYDKDSQHFPCKVEIEYFDDYSYRSTMKVTLLHRFTYNFMTDFVSGN